MKKRIFLIVASVLTCVVTLASVITTIISVSSKNAGVEEKPTQEVEKDTGKDTGTDGNQNVGDTSTNAINYVLVVGDFVTEETLIANYDLVKEDLASVITLTESNKLQAIAEGQATTTFATGEGLRTYNIVVYAEGEGTQENPYNIASAERLLRLVDGKSGKTANYNLVSDIDVSDYESWAPIGSFYKPFKGVVNGNGYSITNMNISVNADNYTQYVTYGFANEEHVFTAGFFGVVKNATIKNLGMKNAVINTQAIDSLSVVSSGFVANKVESYVAPLVAYANNATIDGGNATVSSNIISATASSNKYTEYSAVAGLVAYIDGSVSNYKVESVINATAIGAVSNQGVIGSKVAGAIGIMFGDETSVKNIEVNTNIAIANHNGASANGAIYTTATESSVYVSEKAMLIALIQVLNNSAQTYKPSDLGLNQSQFDSLQQIIPVIEEYITNNVEIVISVNKNVNAQIDEYVALLATKLGASNEQVKQVNNGFVTIEPLVEMTIENVVVKNSTINVLRGEDNNRIAVKVSGFLDTLRAFKTVKNCAVENIAINQPNELFGITNNESVGLSETAGFVTLNNGIIQNCTVSGKMHGVNTAGFANVNNGVVEFGAVAGNAVSVEVSGQYKMAGLAIENFGVITGTEATTEDGKVTLTNIKAILRWSFVDTYFESVQVYEYISAGLVAINAGELANLYMAQCNMYDVVNASSVIGVAKLQSKITNCTVYSTVRTLTINETKYSAKTYIVAGIVAIVLDDASVEVDGADIRTTVNNTSSAWFANCQKDCKLLSLGTYASVAGLNNGTISVKNSLLGKKVYADVVTGTTQATVDAEKDLETKSYQNFTVTHFVGIGESATYENVKIADMK